MADGQYETRLRSAEHNAQVANNYAQGVDRKVNQLQNDFEKVATQTQSIHEFLIGTPDKDGLKYIISRWGEKIEKNANTIEKLESSVQELIGTKDNAHRSLWIALFVASLFAGMSFVLSLVVFAGG